MNNTKHQLMLEDHKEKKWESEQRRRSQLSNKFFKQETETYGFKVSTIPKRRPLVRMGV